MQQTTHRFGLPYIMQGQAQKHVTHNEAIRAFDALLHVSVLSRDIDSPPNLAREGDFYLVSETPSGVFADYANGLAGFVDGAWMHYPPVQGLIVNIEDEGQCVIWRSIGWVALAGGEIDISALSFDVFGINGTADDYNRLLLNSDASLFNHNGAGHQLKINKAAETEKASLLFQDDFSGRAEMGLVGDDNFAVKVSADGANFLPAMTVNSSNANVSFPHSPALMQPVIFNMLGDGGRFGGKPEPLDVRLDNGFAKPDYIQGFNGATLLEGDKYIDNSDNFGGNRGQMSTAMEALARRFKPNASDNILRFGSEFYSAFITAGDGTSGPLTSNGVTTFRALGSLRFPIVPRFTLSFWIRVISGDCVVGAQGDTLLMIDGMEQAGSASIPSNGQWHHVQRLTHYNPATFLGYDVNLYRVYAAAGATFEFAAPVLFPGHLLSVPDAPIGIVNSLTAFM